MARLSTERSDETTRIDEEVRQATTREEREAVYRFRYEVYFEEFGRQLGSPDHRRRMVRDADDELPTTTILYTGTLEHVTGSVRLRHWRAGEVPRQDFEILSMGRFPDIAERNVAEIERLMVRRSARGKRAVSALVRESYRILAGRQATDLCFCYCSPGLVRYYQQLAMRPFGGRPVNAPDGLMLPLVAVMSDRAYYRRSGSFLEPLVGEYFGPGKRDVLDITPYLPLFAAGQTGIEFDPERVRSAVARARRRFDAVGRSFLDVLPGGTFDSLIGKGLVIDVEAGTLVTRQGFVEPELYVVLDGSFISERNGQRMRRHGRGEHFGEDAFIDSEGRRQASIRALESGRLLALPGKMLARHLQRSPAIATSLLAPSRLAPRTTG